METSVQEPAVDVTPSPSQGSSDPFSLDEAKFASLSPEQRAALDPVFEEWKGKAKSEIERSSKTYEEKYKPHMEKAQALDELVKDPRFQQFWNNLTTANANGGTQNSQPKDFASPEEWQQAVSDAYAGNGNKLKEIQARMFATMATPVIQELKKSQDDLKRGQEEFRTMQEMKDLFERHPEAKSLDTIGRDAKDPNDKSLSLLEMCLNWADENGRPMEDGFQMANRWANSLKVGAQQQAMGLVQEKKASVTSGPTTNQTGNAMVEVADADELMQKNMEFLAAGQKPPRFVIRAQSQNKESRWSQRT
jgi:hypothetical protein